jgi:hypothetical protein
VEISNHVGTCFFARKLAKAVHVDRFLFALLWVRVISHEWCGFGLQLSKPRCRVDQFSGSAASFLLGFRGTFSSVTFNKFAQLFLLAFVHLKCLK